MNMKKEKYEEALINRRKSKLETLKKSGLTKDKQTNTDNNSKVSTILDKNNRPKISTVKREIKFDSQKSYQTPETNSTNHVNEKLLINSQSKLSSSNLTDTKRTSLFIPGYSGTENNNKLYYYHKNPISPNVELSGISYKSDPKKFSMEFTPNSFEQHTISDNNLNDSEYRNAESTTVYTNGPSFIHSNYNRGLNRSNYGLRNAIFRSYSQIESSMNKINRDNSYKIIDILDKFKNLVTTACKDHTVLYMDNISNHNTLSTNFDNLFPSSNDNCINRNISEELDSLIYNNRVSIDSQSRHFENTKKTNMNNDIESIYKTCQEFKDIIKNNNIDFEEVNEKINYESTKQSIQQIRLNSEKIIDLYKKLFERCKECLFDINNSMLDSVNNNHMNILMGLNMEKKSVSDKRLSLHTDDLKNIQRPSFMDINNNTEVIVRNSMKAEGIKEKLEKLKILKEKKEQMLSQNNLKIDDSYKKNIKGKINISELDPSESLLNENVLIKLPRSKIIEVNKPANDPNTIFKLSTGVDENSFQEDSEIILNFDSLKEKQTQKDQYRQEEINVDKTINESILIENNTMIKGHKRSKSHVVKKQTFSSINNPKNFKENFYVAKTDLKENIDYFLKQIKYEEQIIYNEEIPNRKDSNCIIY